LYFITFFNTYFTFSFTCTNFLTFISIIFEEKDENEINTKKAYTSEKELNSRNIQSRRSYENQARHFHRR